MSSQRGEDVWNPHVWSTGGGCLEPSCLVNGGRMFGTEFILAHYVIVISMRTSREVCILSDVLVVQCTSSMNQLLQ